jgi:hypothetical protein
MDPVASVAIYLGAGVIYRAIKFTTVVVSKARLARAVREIVLANSEPAYSKVEVVNLLDKKKQYSCDANNPSKGELSNDGLTFYFEGDKVYTRGFFEANEEGRLDEKLNSLIPEFSFWFEAATVLVWPIVFIFDDLWDIIKLVFEAPAKALKKIVDGYAKLLWDALVK